MPCLLVSGLVASPGAGFTAGPLDFGVERGEILSLVGPSGCGKTTLIRTLAGLLAPSAGRIELEGRVLNDPAPRVPPGRRRVGMLFQNLALWPHMRAVDQVAFAMRGWRRRGRAKALLARLGLAGKERCRPGELSGGEGQRVALARALAGDPALLLLDEPLRSVDPHLRAEIGTLLRELVRERGVACLLVTHDREEALTLGDRLAVMADGRILGIGSGPALQADPPHPFVGAFLAGAAGRAEEPAARASGPLPAAGPEHVPGRGATRPGSPGPLVRLGLLAVLLGAGLAAALALSGKRPPALRPMTFTGSAQCKPCHQQIYAEWEESWHAKAWTNPDVRKLSNDFRNRECLSCHAPRPIMETGVDQRVLPRTTRLNEGVDCLACHLDQQGRIMGLRDVPTAACAPVKNDVLAGNAICAPCHNQHFTMDQWAASPAARKGQTCNECHMPRVSRKLPDGTTRAGRSHVHPGGHFPELLLEAVELSVERQGRQIAIAVTNVFAGHNFPTDSRHKASDVLIRFRSGEQWGGWSRVARFRWPYREEPGPNTQLVAGERRELPLVAIPPGAEEAEVRLDYRATPFLPDEGALDASEVRHVPSDRAVVLHTRRLKLP